MPVLGLGLGVRPSLRARLPIVPGAITGAVASAISFVISTTGTITAPAPSSALSAVNAEGWSGEWGSGTPPTFSPDSAPQTVTAARHGYDATGAATTLSEALTLTQRVRQPYPSHTTLTPATVALSDYVYSTDTIAGCANNSTEKSPKPIVQWVTPARSVVANTIGGTATPVEIVVYHRNARQGRQVAAVKFIITDGTTTLSSTVSNTIVSGRTGDRNAVIVYRMPEVDISTLTAGLITVNAEVYPWIGDADAVAKSASDGATARGFSPRYFLKNVSLATNPPYAYVSASGNDSTGVVSTTASTAAATPYATISAAILGIHTAYTSTTGIDGGVVRIGAGSFVLGTSGATRTQKIAALTIERDPAVAKSAAIVTFGAAAARMRFGGAFVGPISTGMLKFRDLTVQRTSTQQIVGESTAHLEVVWEDVALDLSTFNSAYLAATAHDYHYSTTFTSALAGNSQFGPSSGEHRMMRGVQVDAAYAAIEGWCVVGCSIDRAGGIAKSSAGDSGSVVAHNSLWRVANANAPIGWGAATTINGAAFVQNVVEYTSATSAPSIRISSDAATGSNSHIVIHNNTFAGYHINGRANLFYEDGTTARTSRLHSLRGNIHVQLNTKGDIFIQDGSRRGNWAYLYGVGCAGEVSQFIDADSAGLGSSFAQAYPGLRASIGTSATVRNDPGFTDSKATSAGPTAGAGGGIYSIASNSIAKNRLASAAISHDATGAARSTTNDSAGAYK